MLWQKFMSFYRIYKLANEVTHCSRMSACFFLSFLCTCVSLFTTNSWMAKHLSPTAGFLFQWFPLGRPKSEMICFLTFSVPLAQIIRFTSAITFHQFLWPTMAKPHSVSISHCKWNILFFMRSSYVFNGILTIFFFFYWIQNQTHISSIFTTLLLNFYYIQIETKLLMEFSFCHF